MNNNSILNILNGQAMLNYFNEHKLNNNGVYLPFNEAMCAGEVTGEIFSDEFIKCRCKAHQVTIEMYNEITLLPLIALFENRFSEVILWFEDDMFCQINLLTILAYLDQIDYKGKIILNIVDYNFKVVDSVELDAQGYRELYKEVMVARSLPHNIKLPLMEAGVKLYLEHLKEENEITAYIKQYPDLQSDILVQELINVFRKYGLGDTQYMQLIRKCRERK